MDGLPETVDRRHGHDSEHEPVRTIRRTRRNTDARGVGRQVPLFTSSHIKEQRHMNTLDFLDKQSLRDDIPEFGPGDTLDVLSLIHI